MKSDQLVLHLSTAGTNIAREGLLPAINQVAAAGYHSVELAGVPAGPTALEMRRTLADHGLRISGGHFPLPVGEKVNEVLGLGEAMGCQCLCSRTNRELFRTAACLRQQGAQFNPRGRGVRGAKHHLPGAQLSGTLLPWRDDALPSGCWEVSNPP